MSSNVRSCDSEAAIVETRQSDTSKTMLRMKRTSSKDTGYSGPFGRIRVRRGWVWERGRYCRAVARAASSVRRRRRERRPGDLWRAPTTPNSRECRDRRTCSSCSSTGNDASRHHPDSCPGTRRRERASPNWSAARPSSRRKLQGECERLAEAWAGRYAESRRLANRPSSFQCLCR